MEERLRALEQAMWGIRGESGLTRQLHDIRIDLQNWRKEEAERREASTRAVSIALISVTITLIGTVATLVTVLSAQ